MSNNDKNDVVFPVVGKTYNCYDDGKITTSRKYSVYIYKILDYDDAIKDNELKILWELNKTECDHLFDKTSHFVVGISEETRCPKIEIFALTKSNLWFGLGELKYDNIDEIYYVNPYWCAGLLDVENKY